MKEELCKSNCFVPELKQRLIHSKGAALPRCTPLRLGRKAPRVTSHNCGWCLILLSTKAHLFTMQKHHWDMTNLQSYIPNWVSRLRLGLSRPLLTRTKRIWRKSHFFPLLRNKAFLITSACWWIFIPVSTWGYWNRSLQYLIYYTPRVIALLRPNSLSLTPSTQPGDYPPTPICSGPLVFCPRNAFISQPGPATSRVFCFLVGTLQKALGSSALKRENEKLSRLEKINLPQTASLKSCLPRVKN